MQVDHFLTSIFKPENFNEEELNLILSQFTRKELSKHEDIIRVGSVANHYFFLESGFARSYAIDVDGNDVTTKFYSAGDIIIDWSSYFLKTPCKETIQALSPCVAWKIHFDGFMRLFNIESFREVGRTSLINNYFELKGHSVAMITDQAKDRYLALLETKPDIFQNVPLKHIATYLGVTDTSLSRIRKEIMENN